MEKIKKLFGGIDLSWKKLIIFAIITAVYTVIMAIIPITKDTSFRDIAATLEWWILFGVIIICNSKSPKDSALKCFTFFLISQPLIYLLQVPFSWQGWNLFSYYKYWFIWTLLTIPMGYIGYYIKKDNILSVIILLPMLILLSILGIGFLSSTLESFPHHLLSGIFCFAAIILIILGVLNKKKNIIISFAIIITFTIGYVLISNGILFDTYKKYETYKDLKEYNITLSDEYYVSGFISTEQGTAEIIEKDGKYVLKLTGIKNATYKFGISSEDGKQLRFEYRFDDNGKLVLEKVDEFSETNTSESRITKEIAYEGINNYCHSEYDWSIADDNPSMMYLEMGKETETEYQVIFHSYTGSIVYFYVDKSNGNTRMVEYAPTLNAENEAGTINLYDYINENDKVDNQEKLK